MPATFRLTRGELLDELLGHASRLQSADRRELFEPFLCQYYGHLADEDLVDRKVEDLYGAAMAHFQLAEKRAPNTVKVRVYSPDFDQHGWTSSHTVVDIVADDMPFLFDSVTAELTRQGHGLQLVAHPLVTVRRDDAGRLVEVPQEGGQVESFIHVEIGRQSEPEVLEAIEAGLRRVLTDVRAAYEDWPAMRERALAAAAALDDEPTPGDDAEREEVQALLRWLVDQHFLFLGFREYELTTEGDEDVLHPVPGSGLGILRETSSPARARSFSRLPAAVQQQATGPQLLNLTKANARSTVHHPDRLDYIGVKRFDADGRPTGERRFLGLFTRHVYKQWPQEIPAVRRKVRAVLDRAGFRPDSHSGKVLAQVLDEYPREELFQISEDDLFDAAMAIMGLQEQQRLRLLVRRDSFGRFVSCLVFLPQEQLTTDLQREIAELLRTAFDGRSVDQRVHVSGSVLARLHLVIYVDPESGPEPEVADLEARLAQVVRSWTDHLREALLEEYGEERGLALHARYADAFPAAYTEDFPARAAAADIGRIEQLDAHGDPTLHLYRPLEAPPGTLRLRLLRRGRSVMLSDVLPLLEQMGVRIADERPYEIKPAGGPDVWVYDFGLRYDESADLEADGVRERFQESLAAAWRGDTENDGFNRLVLSAGLPCGDVTILRAYAKYLRQTGTAFSQAYMEDSLAHNPALARLLVDLFWTMFDPDFHGDRDAAAEQLTSQIEEGLDNVASLDEDRIVRSLLRLVHATVRTNFFQTTAGKPKDWLSLKLDPSVVPDLPLPRPMHEIFVYSARTEGVHLRGGGIARGGLRWSDRREDFRTEVLGLMKAQTTKNVVIVPVGAKGGFVVKQPPADRDALGAEVVRCYSTFIRGLLDVTDNLVGGEVEPPTRVVRRDGDDTYLVVAADKGTATFSDIANDISEDYGFWLGDAFASGGSTGYDHKAMGITARGAWVSVRRHFRALGIDVQNDDITVVGIGDMSGDVFGNGMLLSRHLKLVAAFDHRHIFLDPDPDPETSFAERQRLFAKPRSSWADYDTSLISAGGGVYRRTAKAVQLSPEAAAALGTEPGRLSPDELIRALLRAPVDLLWNGGIGTYVKASTETHADVGDKGSENVRVDASTLRCKVVGEGGNLGLTQLGRVEFARAGGRVNADAIDNSAGVGCSDREVNIKILLDDVVAAGDMTEKQRNALLADMTDEVAGLVLRDNDEQTRALAIAMMQSASMVDVHARYLKWLEQRGRLDRELEFLPDAEQLAERAAAAEGLTSPEFAVLLAYTKLVIGDEVVASDVPDDPYLAVELVQYFPAPLRERFAQEIQLHPLRRQIIATAVTNNLVNRAGTTATFRLLEETGSPVPDIVRAYTAARDIFDMPRLWDDIEALDRTLDFDVQISLFLEARKLVERSSRWLVRNRRPPLDIAATVERYAASVPVLLERLPKMLAEGDAAALEEQVATLVDKGVPADVAHRVAALPALSGTFDITEVAERCGRELEEVAGVYFTLGQHLRLDWLARRILDLPRDDRWQALARAALRDDLGRARSDLTAMVLDDSPVGGSPVELLETWLSDNVRAVERCTRVLDEIAGDGSVDITTLSVALREIRGMATR
jgi:glutamate dehydrogenase